LFNEKKKNKTKKSIYFLIKKKKKKNWKINLAKKLEKIKITKLYSSSIFKSGKKLSPSKSFITKKKKKKSLRNISVSPNRKQI
jgi:hypothetical protein